MHRESRLLAAQGREGIVRSLRLVGQVGEESRPSRLLESHGGGATGFSGYMSLKERAGSRSSRGCGPTRRGARRSPLAWAASGRDGPFTWSRCPATQRSGPPSSCACGTSWRRSRISPALVGQAAVESGFLPCLSDNPRTSSGSIPELRINRPSNPGSPTTLNFDQECVSPLPSAESLPAWLPL